MIIMNSNFYDITARSGSGGGVVYSSRSVTIVNCTFVDSTTINQRGGVVYSRQGITAKDSTFMSSSATSNRFSHNYYYHGGTLYSEQAIVVTNCIISDSTSGGDGGVAYSSQNVTITNTTITNSVSLSGNGGAVYGLNVKIINSNLRVVSAHIDGGAIYGRENVIIMNSKIINSTSVGNGGATYCGNNVEIVNSIIRDSKASEGNGGAIYSGWNVMVNDLIIENSLASIGDGGSIYSGNDVTAIKSIMSECSALNGKGGAVYSAASSLSSMSNSNIVFSNCTFNNNSATSGGVLYTSGHYNHHMEFSDCVFNFNEAITDNITGSGGVAFIGNTTLAITNSQFKDNRAATDGGVLDLSFSSVSIERSSFTRNVASGKGGVFFGRNYSINFTVAQTDFNLNSAEKGGVFYIRRSNSNIKAVVHSAFIENSAINRGGVMDLGGVSLMMDMDTVIAYNTAGSSGNVISACVSQITAYGLESWLDPVYPLYCTIYDKRNSSHPMSQSISTDIQISPITEQLTTAGQPTDETGTYTHTKSETESFVETITEEDSITTSHNEGTTTNYQKKPSFATTQQSSFMTTTDEISGTEITHTTNEVSSSSPSITPTLIWTNEITTTSEKSTSQQTLMTFATLIATTEGTQPRINGVTLSDNTEKATIVSQATMSAKITSSPTIATYSDASKDNKDFTTMNYLGTTATESRYKTQTPGRIANPTHPGVTTELTNSPDTFGGKETKSSVPVKMQANEDSSYHNAWSSSQQDLLKVAIISLGILCATCIILFAILVVLFFIACRKRSAPPQGYYKRVPLTEKDQEVKLSKTKELGKDCS